MRLTVWAHDGGQPTTLLCQVTFHIFIYIFIHIHHVAAALFVRCKERDKGNTQNKNTEREETKQP
jgi:hypothetical protein